MFSLLIKLNVFIPVTIYLVICSWIAYLLTTKYEIRYCGLFLDILHNAGFVSNS